MKNKYQSKYFKIYKKEVIFENKKKQTVEYVSLFDDTKDAVMVAPITSNNELVFIEQYWPAMDKKGLIFPGGKVDKGETTENAAKRETAEETKLLPNKVLYLATVEILPKYLYGQTAFYIAEDLKETNEFIGDEKDDLFIKKVPLNKVFSLIESGELSDVRTVSLALWVLRSKGL